MFLEPSFHSSSGWIEVIAGSMFSGKTEELLRRVKRSVIAGQSVKVFKPAIDVRYDDVKVVSHDHNSVDSFPVAKARDIFRFVEGVQVVGIDEVQFFDDDIVDVCRELADRGVRVIVAGLDMDYEGKPFGAMPYLFSVAEYVTKVHAVCHRCGGLAHYSYRIGNEEGQVLLGEKDKYEARCRKCFSLGDGMDL